MELILDTTFLIDLEREVLNKTKTRPASEFLSINKSANLQITLITVGEFAEGFKDTDYLSFRNYLEAFPILQIDQEVAWIYGQLAKKLRVSKSLIGSNDMWIAAIALRNNKALVTRNIKHFKKIPELQLVAY